MSDWVRLVGLDELEEDEGRGVLHGGRRFVVFRLEDGVYVLDDVCSHEYSLLSEGEVWDDEVYCPKHGSRFNIKTGQVRGLPATAPVGTYPVRVENGIVYAKLEV